MKIPCSILGLIILTASSHCFAQYATEHRDQGAVLGALLGGLTGAAIGDRNDEALAGAAIGAGVGALTGGTIGQSVDHDLARQQAVQYQRYQAVVGRAVSVEDAISMTQAGLSDNVIATQIRTQGIVYRPRTEDLVRMSQMGVSETVIAALQTAPVASAAPAVSSPSRRAPVVVEERVYVAPPMYVRPYPAYRPLPGCYGPPRGQYHPHYHGGAHWSFSFGH